MSATGQAQSIDEDKMNAFLGKVVGDFGASLSSALVYLGQKLGLYKAMADGGPVTPAELAERTNTNERYVREWLINQAAGGYTDYDPETGRYSLTPEQAVALTDDQSPFYVGGGFFVETFAGDILVILVLALHVQNVEIGETILVEVAKGGVAAPALVHQIHLLGDVFELPSAEVHIKDTLARSLGH